MIKLLEENPLGLGLASVCAALALVSILLAVIWMVPPSTSSVSAEDDGLVAGLNLPELRAVGTIDEFAEITNRPAFNETRLPVINLDIGEGDEDELLVEEVDAPEVELAGVIFTPSLRMATLRTQGEQQSLVAFEGQPLEGNYGTWQITRIEPREVTMASAEGEEVRLELKVHNATIEAPPKLAETTADPSTPGERKVSGDSEDEPLSRAEEIRQRIAERREELRQAAETEEAAPPKEYQQSIRSLMVRNREDDSNNDEKE